MRAKHKALIWFCLFFTEWRSVWRRRWNVQGFWGACFGVPVWLHLTHQIEAKCNMWMLWQMRHTWQKAEVGENWKAKGRLPWGMCVWVCVCLYIHIYVCECILLVCGRFTAVENLKGAFLGEELWRQFYYWDLITQAALGLGLGCTLF